MNLYLGIDAGGTKAEYALAEGEREIARVRGGSIKRMRVDEATATKHLEDALRELEAKSGRSLKDVVHTCIGTAGEQVPMVADWLRKEIGARVGGDLLVLGDVEIALDAAFFGKPGVLVLAGTGSNIAVRSPEGQMLSAGGWGPLLGDDGSGYRIGIETLRRLFREYDRGEITPLMQRVFTHWNVATPSELISLVHAQPGPDFASLARIVAEAQAAGDPLADEILAEQGRALAAVILRLLARAGFREGDSIHFAFTGSVVQHILPVRRAMEQAVLAQHPHSVFMTEATDAVSGALWRARTR
ncbi:N-acetylglucosamine kinase [Granulicella cerasi]|uniref:N-acetylglucosamine kinase n=1 Tax=Granulicella cerasi TaxID=741063 RepID=A0ABW1ZA52_9BACT|nr:BadF/BadG/BcrA/BcrD ATPase family protein [Granulicella cerasi]